MAAKKQSTKATSNDPNKVSPDEKVTTLMEWSADNRIWYPKTRMWYLSYAALISVLIIIAFRMGFFIVVLGLIAFLFLWFVQGSIPPTVIKHKILNTGIISHDTFYRWNEIKYFWMAKKDKYILLHLDFPEEKKLPRQTILMTPDQDDDVFNLLAQKVKYANAEEAEYNILSRLIYGEYKPITFYVGDADAETEEKVS